MFVNTTNMFIFASMSEQITVEIQVKPYVAKYLEKHFGNPVDLSKCPSLRNSFRGYLTKPRFRNESYISSLKYENRKNVYILISQEDFYRHGWELSPFDQQNFNSDVEFIVKQRLRDHLSLLELYEKKITNRINHIRTMFDFSEDDLSYDAIKKDFYRFRKKENNVNSMALLSPK